MEFINPSARAFVVYIISIDSTSCPYNYYISQPYFEVRNGLQQGCTMAPTLFTKFNAIVSVWHELCGGIRVPCCISMVNYECHCDPKRMILRKDFIVIIVYFPT